MMCEAFYQRQLADVSAYTVLESHFFSHDLPVAASRHEKKTHNPDESQQL